MSVQKPLKVWVDGQLVEKEHARVSVYDHGLLYGDGVFEGIRAYSGRVFEHDAHIRRLYESARAIRLTIPYEPAQLKAAVEQTIKANGFTDCYIRLVVTRGSGPLGLNPFRCEKPCVFIITDVLEMYSRSMYENGMAVITCSVIRNHPNACPPRVKSLNYLNNILGKIEAIDAGVLEAIMLNHDGNVAECTADNIFVVKDSVVYTPTTTDGILDGITRRVVLDLCRKHDIPCVEKSLQRHDLYVADELFLTGTGAEVIAATKIDGRTVADGKVGPVTRRLMEAFARHVREG